MTKELNVVALGIDFHKTIKGNIIKWLRNSWEFSERSWFETLIEKIKLEQRPKVAGV